MATETAIDVVMPQMGVSVSEGTVTKWLKHEGESIEADEPLLEISTDKVDTEVPSPASGVVTQIFVQEGETVEVGTKLAQIGGAAGARAPAADAPPEPATQAAAQQADAPSPAESVQPVQPAEPPERVPVEAASENGKAFVSPVVARIASEHGVDPGQVPGTGRGGRVTKKDMLDFIEHGAPAAPAEPAPAPAAPEPAPAPAPAPAAQAAPPKAPPPPQAPAEAGVGEQLEPMTAMRRGIADHMRRSLDTPAHVTSATEGGM